MPRQFHSESFDYLSLMEQLTIPPTVCTLQGLYRNLIHVTRYTHMIARLSVAHVEKLPTVNSLVKHVKKVFEKCQRRVKEWQNFETGLGTLLLQYLI